MEGIMNKKIYFTLSVLLVAVFTLSMGIRANGSARRMPDITDGYYRQIEKAYIEAVRDKLDSEGYRNAGISMTKIINAEGGFDYLLSVHHKRIDKMNNQSRDELTGIITKDEIEIANSSISVKYIEY